MMDDQTHTRVLTLSKWTAGALGVAAGTYAVYVGVTWLRYGHPAPASPDDADPLLGVLDRDVLAGLAHHAGEPAGTDAVGAHAITRQLEARAEGDAVTFAATDLEATVTTSVEAMGVDPGSCTADIGSLLEIAKLATATLTIVSEGGAKLVITTGSARYELPTMEPEDFPTLPTFDDAAKSITLSASTILPMLRSCSYPMTSEDVRFQLAGVLLNVTKKYLDCVAADGHRMALVTHEERFPFDHKVMLPNALVRASEKLSVSPDATDVEIAWTDNHVGLRLGTDKLMHRLSDVNFPQYRQFIPSDADIAMEFDTAELLAAIRSVAPFAGGKARPIRFDVERGTLKLSTRDEARGMSSLSLRHASDVAPLAIGFTANYLSEPLEAVTTQRVALKMISTKGAGSPLLIQPINSTLPFEAAHVVMGMRLE